MRPREGHLRQDCPDEARERFQQALAALVDDADATMPQTVSPRRGCCGGRRRRKKVKPWFFPASVAPGDAPVPEGGAPSPAGVGASSAATAFEVAGTEATAVEEKEYPRQPVESDPLSSSPPPGDEADGASGRPLDRGVPWGCPELNAEYREYPETMPAGTVKQIEVAPEYVFAEFSG